MVLTHQPPRLLIVDESTRGIDIAAKAEVHALLGQLAAEGVAVLLMSSDLHEVLTVSHRILTIRGGRVTGECLARDTSEEALPRLMTLDAAA